MKACRGGDLARWQGYEAGKNASLHHGVGELPAGWCRADDTGGVMNNSLSQATNGLLMQLVMDLKSGYLRRCESLGLARRKCRCCRD